MAGEAKAAMAEQSGHVSKRRKLSETATSEDAMSERSADDAGDATAAEVAVEPTDPPLEVAVDAVAGVPEAAAATAATISGRSTTSRMMGLRYSTFRTNWKKFVSYVMSLLF